MAKFQLVGEQEAPTMTGREIHAVAASPTPGPSPYWIELCRVEFCRRYYEDQTGYSRPRVAMPGERVGDVRPAL